MPRTEKSLVGLVMAKICGSRNLLHITLVEASSQRVMIAKASRYRSVYDWQEFHISRTSCLKNEGSRAWTQSRGLE